MKTPRQKKILAISKPHHVPRVLLLVDTAGAVGRDMIMGIGRYALENGPWSIQYEYRALDSLPPQWLKQWRGDGIISRTINLKQAKILWETKLPLVELHGFPKIGVANVWMDPQMLGRMAAEHFQNCGLRQFGFFTYGEAWWIKLHREAYRQALKERGYDCHIYRPAASNRNLPLWHESQRPGLVKWICSLPHPIGVYTIGDLHSVRLLDMCHELSVAVPEEVAILGVGNDPVICETVRPTLSSVDVNAQRIGYEAAGMLDRMMDGKPVQDLICIPPSHVVIRQSTDLVAIEDADVGQAVRMIREFACAGIDVSRVAEEIGLSRRALERRFRQHLGRTPKAEIMRIRIEHAKTLLARTDKTSESIARKSGFSSLEYFTKVFRRKVGMKPQAFRRMRVIPHDLSGILKDLKPLTK
jgi:LacI family transcriptional regulator